MEETLNNGLTVIPDIIKTVKDMISYFWQPNMGKDYSANSNNSEYIYHNPKREIDKRKHLSLDTIMVLRINPNKNNEKYMITMLGLKQSNCDERILLCNGQTEKSIMEKYLQENLEMERKSVLSYMPSDYVGIYNEALSLGRYECCLTMLQGLESHMNHISEEKNKILLLKKKGE